MSIYSFCLSQKAKLSFVMATILSYKEGIDKDEITRSLKSNGIKWEVKNNLSFHENKGMYRFRY